MSDPADDREALRYALGRFSALLKSQPSPDLHAIIVEAPATYHRRLEPGAELPPLPVNLRGKPWVNGFLVPLIPAAKIHYFGDADLLPAFRDLSQIALSALRRAFPDIDDLARRVLYTGPQGDADHILADLPLLALRDLVAHSPSRRSEMERWFWTDASGFARVPYYEDERRAIGQKGPIPPESAGAPDVTTFTADVFSFAATALDFAIGLFKASGARVIAKSPTTPDPGSWPPDSPTDALSTHSGPELADGVYTIRMSLGGDDLRHLSALAEKALPDVEAYRDRIAEYGDDIGGNQHVLGPLFSSVASLTGQMERLSGGTFRLPPASAKAAAFSLDLGPDISGTPRERVARDVLMDLTNWLLRIESEGRSLVGRFPAIDDLAARRFGSIVRRLRESSGDTGRGTTGGGAVGTTGQALPEAPAGRRAPEAVNTDPVALLKKRGARTQAALVDFMRHRESATFEEVAHHVHGDEMTSDEAIRQNVTRTNESLAGMQSSLKFRVAAGYVFKDDPRE